MQTPYGALSYQAPTSRNCKLFRTQLCELLLATHEIQTLNTYTTKPRSFQRTPISNLCSTQLKQLTQKPTHPLHVLNAYSDPPKNMKATIFYDNEQYNNIISKLDIPPEECRENLKRFHTTITSQYLSFRKNNKFTNTTPYNIHFIHQNKHYHVICVQNWHNS